VSGRHNYTSTKATHLKLEGIIGSGTVTTIVLDQEVLHQMDLKNNKHATGLTCRRTSKSFYRKKINFPKLFVECSDLNCMCLLYIAEKVRVKGNT
jgi:hypothetical protein